MLRLSDTEANSYIQKRILWTRIFIIFLFFILFIRLWYLQIIKGQEYRIRSKNNRIRLREIPAFRGKILDRNGAVLVDNKPSYNLYIVPEEVNDLRLVLKRLSSIVSFDLGHVEEMVLRMKRKCPFKPVCVKRDISFDEVARIETNKLMLPGILIRVDGKRDYVYRKFACHVLGYVSWNEKGIAGIERRWDKILSGVPGGMQIEVDATGRIIRVISKRLPIPGCDVYLTIDKRLQQKAEKLLEGKKGAIVAINPMNGEVLAMASSPSFDPNRFVKGMDKKTWKEIINSKDSPLQNRAINGLYPAGSLFKVIVAIAALQEGIINKDTTFICTGRFPYGNRIYKCWKKGGHGRVDLYKAIKESCDVYFYHLGKKLGVKKMAYYAKMFGLGEKTGLDLGNESKGLVPTAEWKMKRFGVPWQGGENLSLAIGQSFLLVTPIQMAVVYSALFNGGILYKPAVTKAIRTVDGKVVYSFKPRIKRRLKIKKEYISLIKKALIAVVNEPGGTGRKARIEGITVAGKTGTVQLVEDSKEKDIKEHAWFVGIAPAEKPRICVAVIIEHGGHGGSAAAPIARVLIEEYLKDVRQKTYSKF